LVDKLSQLYIVYERGFRQNLPAFGKPKNPVHPGLERLKINDYYKEAEEMKVSEIMNRNVLSVSPQDRVCDVIDLFLEKNITGAPVVEEDKVVGIISRRDILPLVSTFDLDCSSLEQIRRTCSHYVKDHMQSSVITVAPVEAVEKCALIMTDNNINRLPVVDDGQLVGIVTRGDILKALARCCCCGI
jgi:CBS domain-containing protein